MKKRKIGAALVLTVVALVGSTTAYAAGYGEWTPTGGMPGPPLLQRFRGQETAGGTAMVMDWQTHGTPLYPMMDGDRDL